MKRKILFALLAIVSSLAFAFGLSACSSGNTEQGGTGGEPKKIEGSKGLEYALSTDKTSYVCV